MTRPPFFPGFDGLMSLSRREGVDISPTLLRVLTDLYVQTHAHSDDEERQFVELTSRLIDEVDDATRAAVRARLAIYPATPAEIQRLLGLKPANPDARMPPASEIPAIPRRAAAGQAADRSANAHGIEPVDASERRRRNQRHVFRRRRQRTRADPARSAGDAAEGLGANSRRPRGEGRRERWNMAAFVGDIENFTHELGDTLILPARVATQVVNDPGGEPLACAARALEMPSPIFQRVLLFLNPELGSSVNYVYRLSRLYDRLSERSALIMLAAWRGSTMAVTRAKYRPASTTTNASARARRRARPVPPCNPARHRPVRTGTRIA